MSRRKFAREIILADVDLVTSLRKWARRCALKYFVAWWHPAKCVRIGAHQRLFWRHWTPKTWFFTGFDQKFFPPQSEGLSLYLPGLTFWWADFWLKTPVQCLCFCPYSTVVYRWLRGSIKHIIPPVGETSIYKSLSVFCVFILQLEWVLLLWPIVNCNSD